MGVGEEEQLFARLRRRDAAAFDAVYARYHRRVYNFLARLAERRELAEDLFQETWLRLAREADRLKEGSDLESWLFTVARNLYLSHVRAPANAAAPRETAEPPDEASPPEQQAAARMEVARLERALAELPHAAREVLLLVAVEGMEPERAAVVLGIGYDALRQRLSRARAQLAERMGGGERATIGGST